MDPPRMVRYEVHRRGLQWVVYACYYDRMGSSTGYGEEVKRFNSYRSARAYINQIDLAYERNRWKRRRDW